MKIIVVISIIAALTYFIATALVSRNPTGSTIHLVGDSTLAKQLTNRRPLTGWGEPFASMLCDTVKVMNHAKNGSSTKSFLADGHWQRLLKQLRTGDIVMIQFGHNDQKAADDHLYASAWQGYRSNLEHFVNDVRVHGAEPVLLTPIVRRAFDAQGKLQQTHGDYPRAAQAVAADMKVKLIDLNTTTYKLVDAMGPVESKALYLHLAAGDHANYRSGQQDDTHLSPKGALTVATIVTAYLKDAHPGLVCL
jgi:lysophospholipase L1-like esterase